MMKTSLKKKAVGGASVAKQRTGGAKELNDFLLSRDYTGALALLDFKLRCQDGNTSDLLLWIGYCAFHLGNFRRAEETYKELINHHHNEGKKEVYLFLACSLFFQQSYEEAEKMASKGPEGLLRNRLLFHTAHRLGDEAKLMNYHKNLKEDKSDQLSLAAVHFFRSHHQEAVDIYKRLLLDHREDLALNVYIAMCYYKLDYYDVSLEILGVYLQVQHDVFISILITSFFRFSLLHVLFIYSVVKCKCFTVL